MLSLVHLVTCRPHHAHSAATPSAASRHTNPPYCEAVRTMETRRMAQQTPHAGRSLIPTFSMSCIDNPQKSNQFSSRYYLYFISIYSASVLSRGGLYVLVWLALTVLFNELTCISVLRALVRLAAFLNRKDLCDHLLDLSRPTDSRVTLLVLEAPVSNVKTNKGGERMLFQGQDSRVHSQSCSNLRMWPYCSM